MRRASLVFVAVGLILGGLTIAALSRSDAAIASGGSALFSFDGMPASPLPYTQGSFLDGWDVQLHDRDNQKNNPGTLESFNAEHGADCSAPPATHSTGTAEENHVFQCHDHVMTAIDSDNTGYGLIYLTPPDMVDFANGGTVSFDLSTERDSTRDWWDVSISPFLESQATAIVGSAEAVDLQGPNRDEINISTDDEEGSPSLTVITNGSEHYYGPPGWEGQCACAGIASSVDQAMNRQHFKLTLSPTHVRFERLTSPTAPALVFIDQNIPALSWTQGVIQFGHHSYTPSKDNSGSPNTWHWDEVAITPAVPFYIDRTNQPWTKGGNVSASHPAPANSYLRFEAICRPVVNGVAATKMLDTHKEHFGSYMVPIPEGSTSWNIGFTDDGWYSTSEGCLAQGFSVWSAGPVTTPPPKTTATFNRHPH